MSWPDPERVRVETLLAEAGLQAETKTCLPREPSDLERASALLRHRRNRREAFPVDAMFQEPGWELVLDLFIAGEKGQIHSVTGASDGVGIAHTTGLRWLQRLERLGMVVCRRDLSDRRRKLVELAPAATAAMRRYLASL